MYLITVTAVLRIVTVVKCTGECFPAALDVHRTCAYAHARTGERSHTVLPRICVARAEILKVQFLQNSHAPLPSQMNDQTAWLFWVGNVSVSPAPVSPEFCPRCEKVHWCQNQWCLQKSSHFEMLLRAKTVSSFLYSSLFTERPTYICRQVNLHQAVICKTAATDYANENFLKRIRCEHVEIWRGDTHVLVAFFQQNRRPDLFMLNNQNANNKWSDVM